MPEPSEPPGRWGTARPGRRDVLRGAAAVGAFLGLDLAAFLTAFNWIGPKRLTPQAFLDGFNKAFGRHHGYRTNHAKGVSVTGWFDSNGNGRELSKAAVFAPGRTPGIGRFSAAGGHPPPAAPASAGRGLGLAFGCPGTQQWRTAMLNLPVFPDNSPQGVYDRLAATAPVAGNGKPDPNAMKRVLAAPPAGGGPKSPTPKAMKRSLPPHPPSAPALTILKQPPPTPGFADSTFRG